MLAPTVALGGQNERAFKLGVLVSGAGTAGVNKLFQKIPDINGRVRFGEASLPASFLIQWSGTRWEMINDDEEGAIYYFDIDQADVPFPWLAASWAADAGAEPAPTVTAARIS